MESDSINKLLQLKELFEKGVITREELEAEKAKVLGNPLKENDAESEAKVQDVKVLQESAKTNKKKAGYFIGGIVGVCVIILAIVLFRGGHGKSLKLFSGNPTPVEFLTRDVWHYKEVKSLNEKDVRKLLGSSGAIHEETLANGTKALYVYLNKSFGTAQIQFNVNSGHVVGMLYGIQLTNKPRQYKQQIIDETKSIIDKATGSHLQPVMGDSGSGLFDMHDHCTFQLTYDDPFLDSQILNLFIIIGF